MCFFETLLIKFSAYFYTVLHIRVRRDVSVGRAETLVIQLAIQKLEVAEFSETSKHIVLYGVIIQKTNIWVITLGGGIGVGEGGNLIASGTGVQRSRASGSTEFCTVSRSAFASTLLGFLRVPLLAPRILRWFLGFWKIFAPLV
jgi:hypothetical protein